MRLIIQTEVEVVVAPSVARVGTIWFRMGTTDGFLTPEEALQVAEALNEAAEEVRDEDW